VYELAPGTALIEYTFPVAPEHTVVEPFTAPGVAGALFKVIAEADAADVPQLLVAVTLTLPAVEPKVTVAEFVP
jgi:hypothetical protein